MGVLRHSQSAKRIDAFKWGAVTVCHPGVDGVGQGDTTLAGRDGGEGLKVSLGQQPGRCNEGRIDKRLGQCSPAALGGDQDGFDQSHAEAAMVFGHEQTGQAHVDQALPDGRIAPAFDIKPAQNFGPVGAGEVFAHAFGKAALVV